jgi:WhiB family transcriptional regulator, redox-sensing transcriptional regulator
VRWQPLDLSTESDEALSVGDPRDRGEALSEIVGSRPDWHKRAACRRMGTTAFYGEVGAHLDEARAVCASCEVRPECTQAGREERWGVWAGATRQERSEVAGLRRTQVSSAWVIVSPPGSPGACRRVVNLSASLVGASDIAHRGGNAQGSAPLPTLRARRRSLCSGLRGRRRPRTDAALPRPGGSGPGTSAGAARWVRFA